MPETGDRAIAIVGLGAILPDAFSPGQFWENILHKKYSIRETPPDRWSIADYYDPDPQAIDKTYSKIGAWVQGFIFDWKRFRIPPKVAAAMDPSQQWAIAMTEQALSDYGYPSRPLDGERTAVVLGTAMGGAAHYVSHLRISYPEYARALEAVPTFQRLPQADRQAILDDWRGVIGDAFPPITEDSMPGELANIVSGRVANVFNLRGPNFITDAACAASFAAIQTATDLLDRGAADAVLTGGVDHNMNVSAFVKFCKIGALSATGTRPFGEGADGFVMGEGGAIFLLKRLADAERDGDRIYAVIRGIGGSSDGKGKGITAPNPIGQRLAVQRAWEQAELDPTSATLIEAHGTSTRVGDVVEVESLADVFAGAKPESIGLGSVKSNIGHLKSGAGAAGLLKATLAVCNGVLPPTLHVDRPNPEIDFAATPFRLCREAQPWEPAGGQPRRCGVSAYGFGGTNFHLVLEQHVPGSLTRPKRSFEAVDLPNRERQPAEVAVAGATRPQPLRPILALGARSPDEIKNLLDETIQRVQSGWAPEAQIPSAAELAAPERLLIDFGNREELLDRLQKARKVCEIDAPAAWTALQAQGIFRGRGKPAGKIAFLFPGQGSQYLNMGRALMQASPVVRDMIALADRVMAPILDRPLSEYIFMDSEDSQKKLIAEMELVQTHICQPAMLAMDIALFRLLGEYGFQADMAMGHSLGEYAALIASGGMPFEDALEAVAARGREMEAFSVEDNGWMAAVMAPYAVVEQTLAQIDGYVVAANINSYSQSVIGGASKAVEAAMQSFQQQGFEARRIPVSHAFHTHIVAPASAPLRKVLNRLRVFPPRLRLISNVTGDFYPDDPDRIRDLLEQQVASPVQWIKGLESLYAAGARTFVEVGPKKALKGLVDDVLGGRPGVTSLFTNHPKMGELPTFNQALCGLYAAGHIPLEAEPSVERPVELVSRPAAVEKSMQTPVEPVLQENKMSNNGKTQPGIPGDDPMMAQVRAMVAEALREMSAAPLAQSANGKDAVYNRNESPTGSVVISGTGLGLPGAEKAVMDPLNAERILSGEQLIDLIPERFRKRILSKNITRLVKSPSGDGSFETITQADEVIKLAGRAGSFSLSEEYGVPDKLVAALDITTQLAMAAGLEALSEAGIPLTLSFRRTTTGKDLPDRWMLPPALRDETGVIFASAFPGMDRFADELERYFTWQNRVDQVAALEDLRGCVQEDAALIEIDRRLAELRRSLEREPYIFDRQFLFRVLSMGHSQFAEYIGARGPNTQINAACASTTQALGLAEDWIRTGRCRRVIVIAADNVTGERLLEWVGAGFLSLGAAATEDEVEEAALPFDKRRHGLIAGMGACGLVVESEDAVRERGMRAIVELLNSESRNSAYHGSRLDVDHISMVMEDLMTTAERRFGFHRQNIAAQMVFVSHETYTPARGGSASAEIAALRRTFGEAADEIVITNTKGFTGHAMGAGVEDVIAVKILEHGRVPPVPNHREIDPTLGDLNLSRGGRYPVQYALHLAAGFGSQIGLTLTRKIPGGLDRMANPPLYQQWLEAVSGYNRAQTEFDRRVLRIASPGAPERTPAASTWEPGTGPRLRAPVSAEMEPVRQRQRPSRGEPPVQPEAEPVQVVQSKNGNGYYDTAEIMPQQLPIQVSQPQVNVAAASPPEAQPVVEAPAVDVPPAESVDLVAQRIITLVAEKTGYPAEMLELDLDLEADLGIDTVKQAEMFLAIREGFDIPKQETLRLRDYPTIAHAIEFVHKMRPDLAGAPPSAHPTIEAVQPEASPHPAVQDTTQETEDKVAQRIVALVAEKTGYPAEMLELDLDLEADLGVDTVKQAEMFLAIREEFDIPQQENLRLREYPTIGHAIQFVRKMRPDLSAPLPEVETAEPQQPEPALSPEGPHSQLESVAQRIVALVAGKTGYPAEMLELDLDLEADLGIDTVKQAEMFLAIREEFDIPKQETLRLRDYPTIGHAIEFVHKMRPDLAAPQTAPEPLEAVASLPPSAENPAPSEADGRFPRREPVPMLLPPAELCFPTSVTLDKNSRVVVMPDRGGVGKALMARLEALGVQVLSLEGSDDESGLAQRLDGWLAEGPLQGVYWLAALDREPALEMMSLDGWQEANRVRVKNLYHTMRRLYASVSRPGSFLIAATRLGGLHGYGEDGASGPLGGAVSGFVKAYGREQPEALVKVVDFEADRKTAGPAEALIAETLRAPGVVEVGYREGRRCTIRLADSLLVGEAEGMRLDNDTIFVVSGAAGGITSEIVADLAAHSGGTFYLLDRIELPAKPGDELRLFQSDPQALKEHLAEQLKAGGERPTPVKIEKQMQDFERQAAALRAIQAVEAAGGRAVYRSVDLCDAAAVEAVIEDISLQHSRIDVLIHAAGIEASHMLPEKDPAQFERIFAVKADGCFNLLRATSNLPLVAVVVFSSVAGRFGNAGQTDYAAANDLLCKLMLNLKQRRPETRGIAIDWTAWSGVGMATRGSIPKMMEWAGIETLPPEYGVPVVRRELTRSRQTGEVVVAGSLGILTEEKLEGAGLNLERLDHALQAAHQTDPYGATWLLGEVKSASLANGIEIETRLDPQVQPFLFDHQINDTPVLPGVMGIEVFAQAAAWTAQTLSGEAYHLHAVENVQFLQPFKFFRKEVQNLYVQVWLQPGETGEMVAQVRLLSRRPPAREGLPAQEKEHFKAQVRLGGEPLPAPAMMIEAPDAKNLTVTADDVYRTYFHGPAYQVVAQAEVHENGALGRWNPELPPQSRPVDAETLAAPRGIELCFQTAGLWELQCRRRMALPAALRSLHVFRQPQPGEMLYALVQPKQDGAEFDANLVDAQGRVLAQIEGYHTIGLPVEAGFQVVAATETA